MGIGSEGGTREGSGIEPDVVANGVSTCVEKVGRAENCKLELLEERPGDWLWGEELGEFCDCKNCVGEGFWGCKNGVGEGF